MFSYIIVPNNFWVNTVLRILHDFSPVIFPYSCQVRFKEYVYFRWGRESKLMAFSRVKTCKWLLSFWLTNLWSFSLYQFMFAYAWEIIWELTDLRKITELHEVRLIWGRRSPSPWPKIFHYLSWFAGAWWQIPQGQS